MEPLEKIVVERAQPLPVFDSDLHVLCVPSLRDELVEIYQTNEWVYDRVREDSGQEVRGRHPVLIGQINGISVVSKRLFHGGALARIWKDRWRNVSRGLSVVDAVTHLSEHQIPTPRVLFLSWMRRWGFVKVELGFERLRGEDADHHFFQNASLPSDWRKKARRIGEFVARLHHSRFEHGDLNMMNFFFTEDGEIQILDLDKCVIHDKPLDAATRSRNLARLERSARKQGRLRDTPDAVVEEIVSHIRSGYDAAPTSR